MSGRKPLGPQLVHHLEGSFQAKQRLEVILETIAGRLSIDHACDRLGIKPARFHRLRSRVLEVGIADLEPRPQGRPARQADDVARHVQQLEDRIQYLEEELKLAQLRIQLAEAIPHILSPRAAPVKKTNRPSKRKPR